MHASEAYNANRTWWFVVAHMLDTLSTLYVRRYNNWVYVQGTKYVLQTNVATDIYIHNPRFTHVYLHYAPVYIIAVPQIAFQNTHRKTYISSTNNKKSKLIIASLTYSEPTLLLQQTFFLQERTKIMK